MNFWQALKQRKQPILALAPMFRVTDVTFRQLFARVHKPDVIWTEFVSVAGLCSTNNQFHRKGLLQMLEYEENERNVVAQFFGSKPEEFYQCAKLANELGFDGIDINMGCPSEPIESELAGAALINDPKRARAIIAASIEGSGGLPISVKTRTGYDHDILETWIPELLAENPAALTVHCRTKEEMSKVPAKWSRVKAAVDIRNELNSNTVILGNGDVMSVDHAVELCNEAGCEGAMIGRAAFGNPWLFGGGNPKDITPVKRVEAMELFVEIYLENMEKKIKLGEHPKPYASIRRSLIALSTGIPQAKSLRERIGRVNSGRDALNIIQNFKSHLKKNMIKFEQGRIAAMERKAMDM